MIFSSKGRPSRLFTVRTGPELGDQSPKKPNRRKRYGPAGSSRITAPLSMLSIRAQPLGCATTKRSASSRKRRFRSALVERATRCTMLVHLPGGHDAEAARDGLAKTVQTLPAHLRGSLTWDHVAQELNGRPPKTLGWDTLAERLRDLLLTT